MAGMALKLVSTKLAKQLSGYALLKFDIEYAARVFGLAAKYEDRTPERIQATRPSADDRIRALFAFEPILRKGGGVAQMDSDTRTDTEAVKSALFEAGVITYGRCFTSGARTRLSEDIFRGNLAEAKELHKKIMDARNRHVAHSELKMERSIVGVDLVEDLSYGKRPNLVAGVVAARRHVPSDERLQQLQAHCTSILERFIYQKFMEVGRSLREQLLQMPPAQIQALPDFASAPISVDDLI